MENACDNDIGLENFLRRS